MTIPVWPSDLPQFSTTDGMRSNARGVRLVTPMDTGPGKQRSRGMAIRPVSVAFVMDSNLLARFERFYEEELEWGVEFFYMPNQQLHQRQLRIPGTLNPLSAGGVRLRMSSQWLVQFAAKQYGVAHVTPTDYVVQFDLLVIP